MFAGHIGVGLAIGRCERRLNPAVFVLAAVWLDVVLWLFVLGGIEGVVIPPDFASRHQPAFNFPWSHGLLATLWWAALSAGLAWIAAARLDAGRVRAALLMSAAVCSHWLLDALVHAPELPLAGPGSPLLGLGLWDRLPLALGVESLLALAGAGYWLAGASLARGRRRAAAALVLLLLAFTIVGMTLAPAPPSITAMAVSSLLTLLGVCLLFAWIGRRAPNVG